MQLQGLLRQQPQFDRVYCGAGIGMGVHRQACALLHAWPLALHRCSLTHSSPPPDAITLLVLPVQTGTRVAQVSIRVQGLAAAHAGSHARLRSFGQR